MGRVSDRLGTGGSAAPYTALADVYDDIMAEIDYEEWVDFILEAAGGAGYAGGRMLDLGCGTGNATLPMWRRGHQVDGLDASPEMLAVARRKAPMIAFSRGDFRTFRLPTRYALIYSVFDALNNLLTEEDFLACLGRVREHLAPGGVFVFDVNTTRGLRELWQGGVAEGWGDDVYYRFSHGYDEAAELATVTVYCETEEASFTETHQERGYDEPLLRSLLEAAGFGSVQVYSYPELTPAPADAERVWVVARAP